MALVAGLLHRQRRVLGLITLSSARLQCRAVKLRRAQSRSLPRLRDAAPQPVFCAVGGYLKYSKHILQDSMVMK